MGTLWRDQLPNALWAYRTAYKTPLGMSPYQLACGKTCHEVAHHCATWKGASISACLGNLAALTC